MLARKLARPGIKKTLRFRAARATGFYLLGQPVIYLCFDPANGAATQGYRRWEMTFRDA
jgi:hypothetical protein|tara:strand:+ start:128 stop:304 length:177 start_codon:yes stop_codon:yes gene_type:complete